MNKTENKTSTCRTKLNKHNHFFSLFLYVVYSGRVSKLVHRVFAQHRQQQQQMLLLPLLLLMVYMFLVLGKQVFKQTICHLTCSCLISKQENDMVYFLDNSQERQFSIATNKLLWKMEFTCMDIAQAYSVNLNEAPSKHSLGSLLYIWRIFLRSFLCMAFGFVVSFLFFFLGRRV